MGARPKSCQKKWPRNNQENKTGLYVVNTGEPKAKARGGEEGGQAVHFSAI